MRGACVYKSAAVRHAISYSGKMDQAQESLG